MVSLLVNHDGYTNDPVFNYFVLWGTLGVMAEERGAKLYATDERYDYL